MGTGLSQPQPQQVIVPPINPVLTHIEPEPPASQILTMRSAIDVIMADPVTEIHLEIPYYDFQFIWIDGRVYSDEMVNVMHRFNDQLDNFQEFDDHVQFLTALQKHNGNRAIRVIASAALDDQVFREMSKCRYVQRIILFCQNIRRASTLHNRHPKILQCATTSLEVLQMVGDRSIYKQNVLFMLPEDIPVMKKYWINFQCLLLHRDRQYSLEHFVELARAIYPKQENAIWEFERSYAMVNERQHLVKEWMFKDSFYWNLVVNLPKVTNDPKKLAYIRSPVKDMHDTIKNYYRTIKNEVLNVLRVVYLVIQLSNEEKDKIESCLNNYLTFTSFVKGFTNLTAANQFTKSFPKDVRENIFVFEVSIPAKSDLYQQIDNGFIILDQKQIGNKKLQHPDIIFNIFNFFKLTDINVDACSGILKYGGLAEAYSRRENEQYRKQLKQKDKDLLSSYDDMENQSLNIRDQMTVLRMSGHINDAVVHCDSKIRQIESQVENAHNFNDTLVKIDQILIEKGTSLLLNNQQEEAIDTFNRVHSQSQRIVAHLRIAGIYIDQNNEPQARRYFEEIMGQIDNLNEWNMHEQYFRAKHFRNRLLMMVGNNGQAYKNYRQLKNEILEHYDYKSNTIPFWSEIIENLERSSEQHINAPEV